MGKKSRRKAPKAQRERNQRRDELPEKERLDKRWRHPDVYNVDEDAIQLFAREVAEGNSDSKFELGSEELELMTEFTYLMVFQAHKKLGRERALRLVKRWPKLKPYWRRLRRRVCEYCGRRNDLSEPRLWVCGGCGVARYCGEDCQAADFSHHEKCCPLLARRWDGVGIAPLSLIPIISDGSWEDPAVLPSALARERIDKAVVSGEEMELFKIK
jgi:hypothetical protein